MTTGQNDTASLHAYGNALAKALVNRSIKQKSENEFEIFNKALSNNDPDYLTKIDPIVNSYKGLLEDYIKMRIPSSALEVHLELVNSLSAVLADELGFQGVFNDPILGYDRFSTFPADVLAMKSSINNLVAFFKQQGVTFEQNEDGFLLSQGI